MKYAMQLSTICYDFDAVGGDTQIELIKKSRAKTTRLYFA